MMGYNRITWFRAAEEGESFAQDLQTIQQPGNQPYQQYAEPQQQEQPNQVNQEQSPLQDEIRQMLLPRLAEEMEPTLNQTLETVAEEIINSGAIPSNDHLARECAMVVIAAWLTSLQSGGASSIAANIQSSAYLDQILKSVKMGQEEQQPT